jgi:hypothetical protein
MRLRDAYARIAWQRLNRGYAAPYDAPLRE